MLMFTTSSTKCCLLQLVPHPSSANRRYWKIDGYIWHKKPFIPSVTSFEGHKKLLKSVSNPEDLLNILEVAIELITTEQHPNQNENIQNNVTQKKKCELLCKPTKKIFHCIMPAVPMYSLLSKKERRNYSQVHNLIDTILPIVSGSSSQKVQLQLLKNR